MFGESLSWQWPSYLSVEKKEPVSKRNNVGVIELLEVDRRFTYYINVQKQERRLLESTCQNYPLFQNYDMGTIIDDQLGLVQAVRTWLFDEVQKVRGCSLQSFLPRFVVYVQTGSEWQIPLIVCRSNIFCPSRRIWRRQKGWLLWIRF